MSAPYDERRSESRLTRRNVTLILVLVLVATGIYVVVSDVGWYSADTDTPDASGTSVISDQPITNVPFGPAVVSEPTKTDPDTCGTVGSEMTMVHTDGAFVCLSQNELRDYHSKLEEQAYALLTPIEASVGEEASPEAALRALVQLSCEQSLENPYYWDDANYLYESILQGANPDTLVTEWPADFGVALRACYE